MLEVLPAFGEVALFNLNNLSQANWMNSSQSQKTENEVQRYKDWLWLLRIHTSTGWKDAIRYFQKWGPKGVKPNSRSKLILSSTWHFVEIHLICKHYFLLSRNRPFTFKKKEPSVFVSINLSVLTSMFKRSFNFK